MVISFAFSMSSRFVRPHPFVGSRPMKKLRVTLMSGIIARSWNTVAIPASMASRGLSNDSGLPSKKICPSLGL